MKLARRLPSPYREIFINIHKEMEAGEGENFELIFTSQMESGFEKLPLKAEEEELFLQFAGCCGFEESKMQLANMEQYRERLDCLIERLEAELKEKCRMAMSLGTMSGLLLVILLL